MSVLFCDLVGFTAASESADPEEVQARIAPYHLRTRERIEAFGGTVEKFIGDAVMAVFGAPTAHEDDPERAVRAGLAVLEAIEEMNEADRSLALSVRVGVNTGEALVSLGVRPEQGEAMVAGDVVNTAARIQAQAPVDGVAVGEGTFRATERVFEYQPLEPISAKGKPVPVTVWRALRPTARFGSDVIRSMTTPLVGREVDLTLLRGTFEKVVAERSVQLLTVVGEPGVGKSRLVAELFAHVDSGDVLVRWRQGRCLPYGEGITFWALGEILKAHAGIFESDPPDVASARLEAVLPESDDRPWLRARLLPLLGIDGGEAAGQDELFTAWRKFLESVAERDPLVMVVEDIHWADQALLAFLEHLADWAQGVPLLIVCTARPELYETHANWGATLRNTTAINLSPLSDSDTAQLVRALLEQAVLPAETQQLLLERAGGNPLYAEEFVRMLRDRDLLDQRGALRAAAAVPFPVSIQALIAARLDTLPRDRKQLLQDAAVIGKVFWTGALVAMGDCEPHDIEIVLHELSRQEFVRRSRESSMEAETEYGFWHALIRDVAYQQIPRTARAAKHLRAADWLEQKAGERVEDLAEVLAYHYLEALELASAAGQIEETGALQAAACRYLGLAGERALALDVVRAETNLARALALAPNGRHDRAALLERWASAAQQLGRLPEARGALEEALALDLELGELVAAGRVLSALSTVLWALGDPRRTEMAVEALTLLKTQVPGPDLVAAYAQQAGAKFISALYPEAVATADEALQLASELGVPEPARALGFRGGARCFMGDREGLEDMRQALALSLDQGASRTAAVLYANIAITCGHFEGPKVALAASEKGVDFCKRRGIAELALSIAIERLDILAQCGLVDQALRNAGPLSEQADATGSVPDQIKVMSLELRLRVQRGEPAEALGRADQLAAKARGTHVPETAVVGLLGAAQLLLAQERPDQATELLVELERVPAVRDDPYFGAHLPELVRCALAAEATQLAARLLEGTKPFTPLYELCLSAARAALMEATDAAEGASLYSAVATRWQEFGNVPEQAYALLGRGRCLTHLGDPDAARPLRQARELFQQMGARARVEDCDTFLAQTTRLSP